MDFEFTTDETKLVIKALEWHIDDLKEHHSLTGLYAPIEEAEVLEVVLEQFKVKLTEDGRV